MKVEVAIEGRVHLVEVERGDGGWVVRVDEGPLLSVEGGRLGNAEWALRTQGRGRTVGVHLAGDLATLQIDGHAMTAAVTDPRRRALRAGAVRDLGTLVSPMPGVVARVLVTAGESVSSGQVLLVVEAMKMENEHRAPFDGVVAAVHVVAGRPIDANTRLITVEPA